MNTQERIDEILAKIQSIIKKRNLKGAHEGHCTFGVEYDNMASKMTHLYFVTIDIAGKHKYWTRPTMAEALSDLYEFLDGL